MVEGIERLKADEIVALLCFQSTVQSEREIRALLQRYVLLRPDIIDCYQENADEQVAALFRTRSAPTEFLVAQMTTNKSAVVIARVLRVLLREYHQEFVPSLVVDFLEKTVELPGWKCLRGDPSLLLTLVQYVQQYVLQTEEKSRERAVVLRILNDVLKKCIGNDRAAAQRILPPVFELLYAKLHRPMATGEDLAAIDRVHTSWKDIYESVESVFTESALHKRSKLPALVNTFYQQELDQKALWMISDFFELVHVPASPKSKALMDSVRAQLAEFVRCHPAVFGNQLPLVTNHLRSLVHLTGRQARELDSHAVIHSTLNWINAAIPHVFKYPPAFDAFIELFLNVSFSPTSRSWQATVDKVAESVKIYSHWKPKEARLFFDQHHETFLALYQSVGRHAPGLQHLVASLSPKDLVS